MNEIFDCIIVGGGPAGATSAIYLKNAGKSVLLISESAIGGKVLETTEIRNIPGFASIPGAEYGQKLEEQLNSLDVKIEYNRVTKIEKDNRLFSVFCEDSIFTSKTVILAVGTKPRLLGVPVHLIKESDEPFPQYTNSTEEENLGMGFHTCALCDGIFYKDKTVAIIGGGNSAVTEALYLSNICKKVIVIQNLMHLTAENSLVEKLQSKDNVEVWFGTVVNFFSKYDNYIELTLSSYPMDNIRVDGVFISIGSIPNTEEFKNFVHCDDSGYVTVTGMMEPTHAVDGVFAAGDCTDTPIKQITTACAQGTIAAKSAIEYINNFKGDN